MDAVGPGTLLAGRYHVQQRVHQGTWSSVWQAVDETLERPVSLRVVDAGHPRGSDVVDAARRAAGVEDPRLQRVLDVGVEDGLTYVVSEWVGADSLTDLIRSGMPPAGRGTPAGRRGGDRARGGPSSRAAPPDADAGQPAARPRRPGHGHRPGRGRGAGRHRPRRRGRGEPARCPSAGRPDLRRADRPVAAGPDARAWSHRPGSAPGCPVPPSSPPASRPTSTHLCRRALAGQRYDGPADPGQVATALAPWPAGPVVGPRRTSGAFPISLDVRPRHRRPRSSRR